MTLFMLKGLGSGTGTGTDTGREGRESCAKDAKENQKIPIFFEIFSQNLKCTFLYSPIWVLFFFFPLSRPSRNLRALRVRQSAFALRTTNPSRAVAK